MNLEQAKNEAQRLMRSGQAVILKSGSGFGKSSGAFQLATRVVAEWAKQGINGGICTIFAATHSPPDVLGYLYKGERDIVVGIDSEGTTITRRITVTDPSIPLWMISTEGKPAFCYDRVFLIIDEWGQADPETKKPLAEVVLNGGTPPHFLPAGSYVLVLSNEGAAYGVTKEWHFNTSRWTCLNVHGDIEVTKNYMDTPYKHKGREWLTMPATKVWADQHPTTVFEDPPEKLGSWCNPRQLLAYDRYLQDYFEDNKTQEVGPEAVEVGAGTIGMGATTSFCSTLAFRLLLPSYEDVVNDPMGTPVPIGKPDQCMLMAYELAHRAKPDHLKQCIEYMTKRDKEGKGMPQDMAITFVTALLKRDYRSMVNTPAMQAWISRNATLINLINSLST